MHHLYISKKYVFEIIDGFMFNYGLVQIRNCNPKVEKHFGESTIYNPVSWSELTSLIWSL